MGETADRPHRPSSRDALLEALDDYRAGAKDLHEAADQAGVGSWELLEAAQATPDPIAEGAGDPEHRLPPFVRRRFD